MEWLFKNLLESSSSFSSPPFESWTDIFKFNKDNVEFEISMLRLTFKQIRISKGGPPYQIFNDIYLTGFIKSPENMPRALIVKKPWYRRFNGPRSVHFSDEFRKRYLIFKLDNDEPKLESIDEQFFSCVGKFSQLHIELINNYVVIKWPFTGLDEIENFASCLSQVASSLSVKHSVL